MLNLGVKKNHTHIFCIVIYINNSSIKYLSLHILRYWMFDPKKGWMIYVGYIYNTDIRDHLDLYLPILYLYEAFTGKFALFRSILLLFPRCQNQANINVRQCDSWLDVNIYGLLYL